jgi:hypothetical protein
MRVALAEAQLQSRAENYRLNAKTRSWGVLGRDRLELGSSGAAWRDGALSGHSLPVRPDRQVLCLEMRDQRGLRCHKNPMPGRLQDAHDAVEV